jgi:heavy metal sensor kinase
VRLPIRVRLTAWYAVLLAAILIGLGAFVVWQLRADLVQTVDRELRGSSTQIAQGYAYEGPEDFADVSGTVLPHGSSAAQVLDSRGTILLEYGEAVNGPLVSAKVRGEALDGNQRMVTVHLGREHEPYRALVTPVNRRGRQRILVVAQSLREVDESVDQVLVLLLIAGPAALLATALGGWWLARKALLPVGRMTSKAEQIGIDRLEERLAPPATADEIGHLAVTLNAMLDRLEQGVKEKHRLVADASHELRTPLAAMRVELDISLRGDDLTPSAREVLESTLEEVERMSLTVDNLLTLARVDEGRLELLTSRVDVLTACNAAVGPLRSLVAAKRLRFSVEGESCEVEADPQRLQQAIRNFAENAIKYSRVGGEVTITAWCTKHEAGVTVTDNGPGIPPHARQHIFDRFYRVDSARGRDGGGSGLGLAICREIANAHGGRVYVESEEGQGSAFTLALPRIPAEEHVRPDRQDGLAPAPAVSA